MRPDPLICHGGNHFGEGDWPPASSSTLIRFRDGESPCRSARRRLMFGSGIKWFAVLLALTCGGTVGCRAVRSRPMSDSLEHPQ